MLTKYVVVATRKSNPLHSQISVHTEDKSVALEKWHEVKRRSPHLEVRIVVYVTDDGKLLSRKTFKE